MVFDKTIAEIVDENFIYARALHYLGISFFENQEKSLDQVCLERGFDKEKVIENFYDFDSCNRLSFKELSAYPIDLLLEYLRHAHHQFIKDKLPFITHLARNCDVPEFQKLLPEFVEDFIYHVYEEEDSVFKYVATLEEINKGTISNPIGAMMPYKKFSLRHEFDHHQGDDEMKAIRVLVESIAPQNLREQVLIKEVKALDREMLYHAEIENKIFFPKAIFLEKKVNAKLRRISTLN